MSVQVRTPNPQPSHSEGLEVPTFPTEPGVFLQDPNLSLSWDPGLASPRAHPSGAPLLSAGQRVANSRDMDGSPLFLDGDSWQGLPGELSPSSEEPPVTHSEPTHLCALLLQLWGRGAFHTHVAQGADRCPSPPQPRGSWPSPPGRRRDERRPPTLLTVSSPSLPPSWDPSEQLPEEKLPASQAGQVHQSPCTDGWSPTPW